MTQWVDPIGNPFTVGYDPDPQYPLRILQITDCLNQTTTLEYNESDPFLVSRVNAPFPTGRHARFAYSDGRLTTITDTIGIQSVIEYENGTDLVHTLTTPYGVTTFTRGTSEGVRWIEIGSPDFQTERVEYREGTRNLGSGEPIPSTITGDPRAGLAYANTFYWDKQAMAEAPGDITKAEITQWLYNNDWSVSNIPGSEKAPFENRVWYSYDNQADPQHVGASARPTKIARVLADGTTQVTERKYNGLGNVIETRDPTGRFTNFAYEENGIDLQAVYQRRPGGTSTYPPGFAADKIASYTYDPAHPHLRASETDASGQTTHYTYTANHQLETITDAKGEVTTFGYGDGSPGKPAGYLTSITRPMVNGVPPVQQFLYDSANHVFKQTESDGFFRTFSYDALDRLTRVTYPDTTFEEFQYTRRQPDTFFDTGVMSLDVGADWDRMGRPTYRAYDSNRRLIQTKDPENRITGYDWCDCGSLGSITDAEGRTTTFFRDLQGRLTRKQYHDGTGVDYRYEGQVAANAPGATSRVKSVTDAKGQRANYIYFADSNLAEVSYTDVNGAPLNPVTPTVSYLYDEHYDRLKSMADGTGHTAYTYNPIPALGSGFGAGRLEAIDGPLINDTITYAYDQLGRVVRRAINGVGETMAYDALSRLTTSTNDVLGNFTRTYDDVIAPTARLASLTAVQNGQATSFHYFGGAEDRRVQYLESHQGGGQNLSRFDYSYDADGQIRTWSKLLGATSSTLWLDYDDVGQLRSARNAQQLVFSGYAFDFGYDLAGNRLSDRVYNPSLDIGGGTLHEYQANSVNQLKKRTTSVDGMPTARVALQYDPNGNMTYDGENQTYEWDAANRLIAINYLDTGKRSEFAYDGANRRTSIIERGAGETAVAQRQRISYSDYPSAPFTAAAGKYATWFASHPAHSAGEKSPQHVPATIEPTGQSTTVRRFIWDGTRIAEERDASGAVVIKRFFAEAEQRWNGKLAAMESFYYTRDHLGSIRELTDANGDLRARYDYDVWGNSVVLEGDMSLDFGYTGHYFHAPSGLNLTLYRAYIPAMGRWLSRDPIGENGGLNLYSYTENNPLNGIDPLGTDTYWHDAQDTVAGFISGLIPFLPYDASNDAMRYGHYIGVGTSLVLAAEGLVSGLTRCVAKTIANPVPTTMARVIPERIPAATLGRPGAADIFVTAADDIAGMNAAQIAERLTIPGSPTGFRIIEFPTPQTGVASPVFRTDPGFIGGGRTLGGAREFVIPNGPIPTGAIIRTVR